MAKKPNRTNHAAPLEESPETGYPYKDLVQNEQFVRQHNEVMEALSSQARQLPGILPRLFAGFLEIANFMLKNTCGLGSNFKLADCLIAELSGEDIRQYYALVLTILGFHFGTLMPSKRELVWKTATALSGYPDLCREFAVELEECRDHQDKTYSQVRAGRKLWERAARLLRISQPEKNTTARIYYQTAPGQDLVFITEKAVAEGWFAKE